MILRTASPIISVRMDRALSSFTRSLLTGRQAWFVFPVWLGICGGILSAVVPVLLVGVLIMALYAVSVVAGLLVWLICVGLLRVVDQAFVLAYRILQTCRPSRLLRPSPCPSTPARPAASGTPPTPDLDGAVPARLPVRHPAADRHRAGAAPPAGVLPGL